MRLPGEDIDWIPTYRVSDLAGRSQLPPPAHAQGRARPASSTSTWWSKTPCRCARPMLSGTRSWWRSSGGCPSRGCRSTWSRVTSSATNRAPAGVRCRRNSAKRRARRAKPHRWGCLRCSRGGRRLPAPAAAGEPFRRGFNRTGRRHRGGWRRARSAPAADGGAPPVAVDLEVRFDDGRVRRLPVRSRRVGQRLLRGQGPRRLVPQPSLSARHHRLHRADGRGRADRGPRPRARA